MNYDLHSHTACSDGWLQPEALIKEAAAGGVDVLALTDHDTTEGLARAQAAAAEVNMILVPGVEISVTWGNRTVHVIGLNIDIANESLQAGLSRLRAMRNERAMEMDEKLKRIELPTVVAKAHVLAEGSIISRTHYARALVAEGAAKDLNQAFKKYLTKGTSAFVSGSWASLEEAIQWIHDAGGQAVIAHPGRYKFGRAKLAMLIEEFKAIGGEGIEVVSGSQHPDDTTRMSRLAAEWGLLASAGSDYHGPDQRWLRLGKLPPIPDACTPIWHDWGFDGETA